MEEMLPNYVNTIILNATKEKSRLLGESGWVGELIQRDSKRPKPQIIFKLALKDE